MRHKLGMLVLVGTILATAQALGGAANGSDTAACPPGCCEVSSCSEPCGACPMPCASEVGATATALTTE